MNSDRHPQKIGLFGGTFDPVHIGHLIVAEWVCDALGLDRIIFVPNRIHPFHKRQGISESQARFEMLQLALRPFPKFEISRFELDRDRVSYTIDTVRHFKERFPNAELFVIIGADNLDEFDKWKEPQAILQLAHLVVYNRKGYHKRPESGRIIYLETPHIEISSTQIRERLKNGQACRALLPGEVYDYILKHHLYRGA